MLFVLFEHASGYAIFRCHDVEDIGSLLPEVQEAMADFTRFTSMVQLEAFSPFKTGAHALENINSISEGSWQGGPKCPLQTSQVIMLTSRNVNSHNVNLITILDFVVYSIYLMKSIRLSVVHVDG